MYARDLDTLTLKNAEVVRRRRRVVMIGADHAYACGRRPAPCAGAAMAVSDASSKSPGGHKEVAPM
jgi:hypothetical protein